MTRAGSGPGNASAAAAPTASVAATAIPSAVGIHLFTSYDILSRRHCPPGVDNPATISGSRYIPALRIRALTRFYDPVVAVTTRERLFKRRLLEQLAPAPGQRILDLGCGTGTLALRIKEAEPGAEVRGIDADPEMLARASAKAGASDIGFDRGMADELPYADGSFDRVASTLFFHHLSTDVKRAVAAEVARVLTPGGELHVADWGPASDPLMSVLGLGIRALDGFEPTSDNFGGRLPRIFAAAGLVNVKATDRIRTAFGTLVFYEARTTRDDVATRRAGPGSSSPGSA